MHSKLIYALIAILSQIAVNGYSITFPETLLTQTVRGEADLLSLQQADGGFERKLAVSGLWGYPLWDQLRLVGKLVSAPDFSQDTKEASVFQSFLIVGGLAEYSWIKWFRYYMNTGPLGIYQKVTYQFENQKESFADLSLGWEVNIGIDYAINNDLFVSYSLGRRIRPVAARIDKMQSLGISFRL